MRIVAGKWRGRVLVAPPGQGTRPTADRVRQALFDMLMHAEWGGREVIEDAVVLDVFAGTGALGLEALSRGAASACFIEREAVALRALRANVAACKAEARVRVVAEDVFSVGDRRGIFVQSRRTAEAGGPKSVSLLDGAPASLVFLDPPYGQELVPRAIAQLNEAGRIGPGALIVAETGRDEIWVPEQPLLVERHHGAARTIVFWAD